MGLEVGGGTEEEEKEKIPLCESLDHRPFGAAAQKRQIGRLPKDGKNICHH